MANSNSFIRAVKVLLYLSIFAFLIVVPGVLYPFVAPKVLFYRAVIELALVVLTLHYFISVSKKDGEVIREFNRRFKAIIKNPLFLAVVIFLVSAALSTVLAPNAYRGFFGNLERGEGLWGLLHYGLFLFIGLLVFRKEDWLKFAKILLIAVFVMMVWGWLQFSKLPSDPSLANKLLSFVSSGDRLVQLKGMLGSSSQPGSFAGNSNFLAGMIIISLGAAVFSYSFSPPKSFFRYASPVFAIAAAVTVFITSVRGAVLGLTAGVLFLLVYFSIYGGPTSLGRLNLRKLAIVVWFVLLVFGGVFWFTRASNLWQKLPGFDRFSSVSFSTPSVATRLIATKVSWNAFKEKPLLGWGMENYSIAYNKHFDPAYSFYAEDWFDRAHNRFLDVLVMQGLLGAIAYLGIFAVLLRQIFRKRFPFSLAAVFVAYFVQSLFTLDSVTSYIPLFTLFGLVIALGSGQPAEEGEVVTHLTGYLLPLLVILGGGYALYTYNFLPWYQLKNFSDTVSLRVGEKILAASDAFLYPYNFAQKELRAAFLRVLYDNGLVNNANFTPLVQKSVVALEAAVEREPHEPRDFITLAETYNELAKNDPSFFRKSEEYIREAVRLSPRRQGVLSELAVTLAGMGRRDEALKLSRELVAVNDGLAKAHYQLALTLALLAESPTDQGEAERELDLARELAWGGKLDYPAIYYGPSPSATQAYLFSESDLNNMLVLYRAWGQPEKIADVFKMLLWVDFWYGRKNPDYYYSAIDVYRALRDKEGVVTTARQLKLARPALSDKADAIIDLAEKGNWEILDTL